MRVCAGQSGGEQYRENKEKRMAEYGVCLIGTKYGDQCVHPGGNTGQLTSTGCISFGRV